MQTRESRPSLPVSESQIQQENIDPALPEPLDRRLRSGCALQPQPATAGIADQLGQALRFAGIILDQENLNSFEVHGRLLPRLNRTPDSTTATRLICGKAACSGIIKLCGSSRCDCLAWTCLISSH